jgi:iron complex transport system permease protein
VKFSSPFSKLRANTSTSYSGKVLGVTEVPSRNATSAVRWLWLLALFFAVVIWSLTWGAPVSLRDLWSSDITASQTAHQIYLWTADGWGLRPPRVLAGLLVGASLAASGAALQTVFRNPLAEPYLLGVSAGGALGAAVALWLQPQAPAALSAVGTVSLFALLGSLFSSFLVYRLGQARPDSFGLFRADRSSLLLCGVAISSLLTSLMSLIVTLSARFDLATQIQFWLLGGLANATMPQNALLLGTLVLGLGLMLSSSRDLNALQLGDEEAASLGVSVTQVHRRLLLAAALMSSTAVATAGLIGFVGLLAPHLMRLLFGHNTRAMLPAAAIGGATLLCACDTLARSVATPIEIPVGIITALLGVPLFLWLLRRI